MRWLLVLLLLQADAPVPQGKFYPAQVKDDLWVVITYPKVDRIVETCVRYVGPEEIENCWQPTNHAYDIDGIDDTKLELWAIRVDVTLVRNGRTVREQFERDGLK
jgi:hypothetical protein